ncbi:integral membrane protein-like protein [Stemphylium lycopersici]|nr:integral membrane protein-like protein [Stemphylium lycopersici]
MAGLKQLDIDSQSFELPHHIHPWLRAVVALGFISFFASVSLLLLLAYKLISWQLRSKRSNQFIVLIFNLLWADIQQSLAFLLNVEWLRLGSLEIENPVCFAQGWLVSTGDVGSGVWCFLIGLHTFASVILNYRLKPLYFYLCIFLAWVSILVVSTIPVWMHGKGVYVRSGVWCWVGHDMEALRLWTHYVWIFIFEFGNILIYALIYIILIVRIRGGYYTIEQSKRVRSIANLMVVYPLVYVICTIPLASARMASMSGSPPSLARLSLAGAIITSNGWLDVLLYTCTRRIMIFSDEPLSDENAMDTFAAFWIEKPKRFGGECTVEATNTCTRSRRGRSKVTLPSSSDSSDDLCRPGTTDIKMVTTTRVTSEPAQPEDFEEMEAEARRTRPRTPTTRWSSDTGDSRNLSLKELALPHIEH